MLMEKNDRLKSAVDTGGDHPAWRLVETPDALGDLAAALAGTASVALDLEADTLHHYRETACLAQLAAGGRVWLVDLCRLDSLAPLRPLLEQPAVEKVLHGADYDIRLLRRYFGIECRPVFDTEVAARFLGHARSGLAGIMRHYFGVRLEKKFQKHDWTKRPLSGEMCRYAAADVERLIELAVLMKGELAGLGRLEWVFEECSLLAASPDRARVTGPLFTSFRGADRLDRRRLAVLEALLQLRERLAAEHDRPPFKILSPDIIRRLVEGLPASAAELPRLGGSGRRGDDCRKAVLGAVREALALPEARLPEYPRPAGRRPRPGPAVLARVRALKEWRASRAAALGLEPSLVCANSVIEQLADQAPLSPAALDEVPRLRRWQKEEFGAEIMARLAAAEGR